ncbi:ATP-binding protein [Streptomyces sp. NPDC057474]|uniref:ATP-binding protein n=1 Tax=Streptomyces sp. NPDC057474 TaxID=3346144 RepID=UPI00368316AA
MRRRLPESRATAPTNPPTTNLRNAATWFFELPASPPIDQSHRGYGYDSAVNETLTLIAAELAANAVRHGHVPGRDFHLRLTSATDALRLEVTDTRTERVPPRSVHEVPGDAESGRGLLLVARLATRWGADPRHTAPGKTVWGGAHAMTRQNDEALRRMVSEPASPGLALGTLELRLLPARCYGLVDPGGVRVAASRSAQAMTG